jgi:phosphoglycolate phosphatase
MDILTDLDGTIVDPAAGILASVRAGLVAVGQEAPPVSELGWVIGPPLRVVFPKLGVPTDRVEAAVAGYRANYRAGAMFDVVPYPNMDQTMRALKADGHRLIVVTSKPHAFARPIIAHIGLADVFHAVHGPELDGTHDDKGDLLAHVIATENVDPRRAVMIGDRKFDADAARRHGVPAIGVTWGYGDLTELTAARVAMTVDRWPDVPAAIRAVLGAS